MEKTVKHTRRLRITHRQRPESGSYDEDDLMHCVLYNQEVLLIH